mmetsp:Transcript_52764/g.152107  ORF Transcript_52764/g.152107 Transcript_52764/m.152107 type:complete len:279 (-) Transcript_52764:993-1829(-)
MGPLVASRAHLGADLPTLLCVRVVRGPKDIRAGHDAIWALGARVPLAIDLHVVVIVLRIEGHDPDGADLVTEEAGVRDGILHREAGARDAALRIRRAHAHRGHRLRRCGRGRPGEGGKRQGRLRAPDRTRNGEVRRHAPANAEVALLAPIFAPGVGGEKEVRAPTKRKNGMISLVTAVEGEHSLGVRHEGVACVYAEGQRAVLHHRLLGELDAAVLLRLEQELVVCHACRLEEILAHVPAVDGIALAWARRRALGLLEVLRPFALGEVRAAPGTGHTA